MTKVLLIEDYEDDRDVIPMLLRAQDENIEVATAGSLKEGLGILEKSTIDVCLLDLGLPDSQGLDTFTTIHTAYPSLPVIVLTGRDDADTIIGILESGAAKYIVKASENAAENLLGCIYAAIEAKRNKETAMEVLLLTTEAVKVTTQAVRTVAGVKELIEDQINEQGDRTK